MTEKEAKMIVDDEISFASQEMYGRALGYLEALAKMEKGIEAIKGLSYGTDWNNGTHAIIYRPKLLQFLAQWETIK